MRVTVKVKPGARTEEVRVLDDGTLQVSVKAPPIDGKANEAVIVALARHYDVRRSRVLLLHGGSARTKVFEIDTASE